MPTPEKSVNKHHPMKNTHTILPPSLTTTPPYSSDIQTPQHAMMQHTPRQERGRHQEFLLQLKPKKKQSKMDHLLRMLQSKSFKSPLVSSSLLQMMLPMSPF